MELIKRSREYRCRRFDVVKDIYDMGELLNEYYYLQAPKAVAAIPVYKHNVILVEQYRASVGKRFLELPGGRPAEGETPQDAVIREIREEIGGVVDSVKLLTEYYPLPSVTTQSVIYFIANVTELVVPQREITEQDMKMFMLPEKNIEAFLSSGILKSGIEAIGLYEFLAHANLGFCDSTHGLYDARSLLEEI